jgi:hypothetical protein
MNSQGRGVAILCSLEKLFPFPDLMKRYPRSLHFGEVNDTLKVDAFGWQPNVDFERVGDHELRYQQSIEVHDYVSESDFVIKLVSISAPGNEIILAKTSPEATLAATWKSVAERIRSHTMIGVERDVINLEDFKLTSLDEIKIPIISFALVARVPELTGITLIDSPNQGLSIVECLSAIQIHIDECGAEAEHDRLPIGREPTWPLHASRGRRRMIFDRPFLIALREWKAAAPYFIGWIENAELFEFIGKLCRIKTEFSPVREERPTKSN